MSLRDIRQFDEIVNSRYSNSSLYQDREERAKRVIPEIPQETKDKIKQLKSQGLSYAKIGNIIGVSKSAISGAVFRHNL